MFRKTIPAAAAAVALGAGLLTFAAPADAGAKVGTVTVKEAAKVQKEFFKQKCLSVSEVSKIVHGTGNAGEEDSGWEQYFEGPKGSRVHHLYLFFGHDKCLSSYDIGKR